MKRIRNWKIIADCDLYTALKCVKEQKYPGYIGPFAIRSCRKQYEGVEWNESFTIDEIEKKWSILVPDNDEEAKNNKVRKLVKDSNCSGLSYDKIDNMTIKELWKHIESHLDADKMYRMLLLYYKEKVYKDNN